MSYKEEKIPICPEGYPECIDPEVQAFEIEKDPDEDDDIDDPIPWDFTKTVDGTIDNFTYIRPELMADIPPPTKRSIRKGLELLKHDCYADYDPRNEKIFDLLLNEDGDTRPRGVSISERYEWGAKPAKRRQPLKIPVQFVRFTYTETDTDIFPLALEHLHDMQRRHMDCGKADVNYNFMVGLDGQVYEGRGFYVETERPKFYNTYYENLKSNCLDIAYMGEYDKDKPPSWVQLYNAIDVVRYAVEAKILAPNFKVIPFSLIPPLDPELE